MACPVYTCKLSKASNVFSYNILRDGTSIISGNKTMDPTGLYRPLACYIYEDSVGTSITISFADNTKVLDTLYTSNPYYCKSENYPTAFFDNQFTDVNVSEETITLHYNGKQVVYTEIEAGYTENLIGYYHDNSLVSFIFYGIIVFFLTALLILKIRR